MSCQEVLGKRLGTFQLCCPFRRTEGPQAAVGEKIHNAIHQWLFRADDGQSDVVLLGKICQCCKVVDINGDIPDTRFQRCARIARCHKNHFHALALCCFPRQCVFPSAGADHQNIHA